MKSKQKLPNNNERASQLFTPTERDTDEEAKICLNCKQPNCKGDCEYFEQEKRKLLKELINEK